METINKDLAKKVYSGLNHCTAPGTNCHNCPYDNAFNDDSGDICLLLLKEAKEVIGNILTTA